MQLKSISLVLLSLCAFLISPIFSTPISETTKSIREHEDVETHIFRRSLPSFITDWDLWQNWEKAAKENPSKLVTMPLDTPSGEREYQSGSDGIEQPFWTYWVSDEDECYVVEKTLQIMGKLGSGAYGDVYKGVLSNFDEDTNTWNQDWNMAVKRSKKLPAEMIAGAKLRQSVSSDYLVSVVDYFYVKKYREAFLIMPKASTDLNAIISNKSMSRAILNELFYEILLGVQTLHTPTKDYPNGIMHRDLKPGNVLVFKNIPKISDFDSMTADAASERWDIGTPGYVAPEVVRAQSPYSKKVDIFALGISYLDMAMHGLSDDTFYETWKALVGPTESKTLGLIPDDVEKVLIEKFGTEFDSDERAVLSYILCEPNERFDIDSYVRYFGVLMGS
ncbi:serine/threonine protein kinase [Penicillium taxi]|uniref:serine/threonine protein kinase n=1 Tax=Penicillium taxi TaxID=168475 RepID=UPI0025458827|nr:serine/threonine protein kinase [Penicillium taxi]KAJ5898744.1 serine/threonine protein kinase [Penicillium taxi]